MTWLLLLVPGVREGTFWSNEYYSSYSRPPWVPLFTLQSILYQTVRIIFSDALHVYHLFPKSKLINSIEIPCPHPLLLSPLILLNIVLQEGLSACHSSTRLALFCHHSFSPSNTSLFVPSWVPSLEHVSASKLQPSLTSRPSIWKSRQFKHHKYAHLPPPSHFPKFLAFIVH